MAKKPRGKGFDTLLSVAIVRPACAHADCWRVMAKYRFTHHANRKRTHTYKVRIGASRKGRDLRQVDAMQAAKEFAKRRNWTQSIKIVDHGKYTW